MEKGNAMPDRLTKEVITTVPAQMLTVPFEQAPPQATGTDEPLLLRTHEAAKLLQISERKLYYLLKDGTIPVVRFGRSVRVSKSAILRYIQQQEQQGG